MSLACQQCHFNYGTAAICPTCKHNRIAQLEALIRDVAIPALLGNMLANEMRCDDQREEYEKGELALNELREAINAKITGC